RAATSCSATAGATPATLVRGARSREQTSWAPSCSRTGRPCASASSVAGIRSDDAYAEARPLWADVDLGAITHNVALLRERAGRQVRILAALKANAYGHGVVAVANHLESIGVDGIATANLDDALAVRRSGFALPILMYGSALPGGLGLLVANDLTPSI